MRIFVFEFIAGGGMLGGPPPQGSLLHEGAAMLRAVVSDLARIEGCRVATTWDARLDGAPEQGEVHRVGSCDEEQRWFRRLAAAADSVLVIAPEFDGLLLDRVKQVEEIGGKRISRNALASGSDSSNPGHAEPYFNGIGASVPRLISPGGHFVAIAGDKHATGRRLASAGVPTPRAIALRPGEPLPPEFPYPAVLKPYDGAGSTDIFWIDDSDGSAPERPCKDRTFGYWRLEQYCPGMTASISLLCGPAGSMALPACRQVLSDDRRFRYLGGEAPLAPELHRRAASLAHRALDALPPAVGYVGFDLVLGRANDGSQDVVIEVNPRLTTSYVGLRRAVDTNLAELMLQSAFSSLRLPNGRSIA